MSNIRAICAVMVISLVGCGSSLQGVHPSDPVHSKAADRQMLKIPAGPYIRGSSHQERQQAYNDFLRTAGSDTARKHRWFDRELAHQRAQLPAFSIDRFLVTNNSYAEFVRATSRAVPKIDRATWKKQGFVQHYETQVRRYNWSGHQPPKGRGEHPVVLVTWADAVAFCRWRGTVVRQPRRLPTAVEYEKAARGTGGNVYPWGEFFEAGKFNNGISGRLDTSPVTAFPAGVSPFGMYDAAGNVFQWTSTPWPYRKGAITVKGSAWDDYAGLGRGAAQHGRRSWVRHVLVGFRCAGP